MSRNNGSGRRGAKKNQVQVTRTLEHEIRSTRHGVSANHLLNFSLPERETHVHTKKTKKKSGPTRTQNEFLHANFRFVIAPLEDDANTPFWDMEALTEWKNVEQVLLWHDGASPMSCPICLDDFRAPKITKCGHIFCWPCILRYLSLSDKYWRRCPMCFDSVQKGQLRSVRLEQVDLPPRVATDATFQFLERNKSSFFPHLRAASSGVKKRARALPSVDDPAAKFARILEATREYVVQLLVAEMRDLEALDAECRSSGDADSLPFVEEAMRATSGRLALNDSSSSDKQPEFGSRERVAAPMADGGSEVYSFYQLANGIYVVLHPLNMKCLLREFAEPKPRDAAETLAHDDSDVSAMWTEASSMASTASSELPTGPRYELLPERVHGRVLDVEHVVMDDDMCKRYRFLSHLPRFCDFYLCELDLSEFLSPATLSAFRGELKKRERQRKQKQQEKSKSRAATRSPIFKGRAVPGFSIEQDGMSWPAPAEMALSEAFDEQLQLQRSFDDRTAARVGSASSPPLVGAAFDDEGSFATVTRQSGYYPPLGSSSSSSNAPAFGDYAHSPSAWGVASSSPPPLFDLDLDALPRTKGKGKKGAGGKRGVALFSTSQHRSYR